MMFKARSVVAQAEAGAETTSPRIASLPAPGPSLEDLKRLEAQMDYCPFEVASPHVGQRASESQKPAAEPKNLRTVSSAGLGRAGMAAAEIREAIDRLHFHEAVLPELLTYAQGQWNGKDTVIALGSPDRSCWVPVIGKDAEGRRKLGFTRAYPTRVWKLPVFFLVVPKQASRRRR